MSVLPSSPPPVTGSDPRLLLLHLCPHFPHSYSALLSCVLACLEPLGHLPVAPVLTPPSMRSSLSRSAWAPHPPHLLTPSLSRALTPQCGLTSLLHFPSPWAGLLFLLVLSTSTEVNFPFCPSPTMEKNSRGFVSSWLNSLCPEECLGIISPQ